MKNNQIIKSPWWLYLLSMLIFAGMGNILFGGLKGMLEYKKSYEVDLSIDLKNLHFFTKDYVKRLVQQLTVSELPAETELTSFHIFTNEKSLDSLESNLPSSGKTQFREGHIRVDPEGMTSPIEYRFRGGLPLHWLYKKKSLRVKLPAFTTYLGERQFNLVNPSTIYTIPDWISYEMAKSVGLLTPDFFPVRLFINDETNGIHFFLSRIDESFLRKNRRMPGSIYSGDTVYTPSPFAAANATEMHERVFSGKEDNVSLMWKDHRLWKKNTSRNAEMKQHRGDIKKFVEIINNPDAVQFMQDYEVYFDKEKFNLFWGVDSLLGAYHHDLYHNHKIYFDPYKGKVEPVEWDVRYWSMNLPVPDYPLLKQVKLNPVLDFEKNQVLYELWKKFSVDDMMQNIIEKSDVLIPELKADPYRQQPDKYIKLFSKDKVVPFSLSEFDDAIEVLKLTYQARHKAVKDILENSVAAFKLESTGSKRVELNIAVSGDSPVDVNPWSLIPQHLQSRVEIKRVYQGLELSSVTLNNLQRLFPGKTIKPGNAIGKADEWSTLTYGKDRLEVSALHYRFLIKGVDLNDLNKQQNLQAINSITGRVHLVNQLSTLPANTETRSVHPWAFINAQQKLDEHIVLSGEINILQDRVYRENQQVSILPGTTFKLAKGRSLVFYGKVTANGNSEQPIRFIQKDKGESWGSIIIQGASASSSSLTHIEVSGGSVSTQGFINYPGQLNIHDVNEFTVDHCRIKNNTIGDDALHVAYSNGSINHCVFENTAFDALDMDIVDVTVANSQFINIGNDAVDLMSSNVELSNLSVSGAGDKCFSIGESSDVKIKDSKLIQCQTGIAVKDESKAYLDNLQFNDIEGSAIALYRKNARYGSGGEVRGQLLHGISEADISVGTDSVSHISSQQLISKQGQ